MIEYLDYRVDCDDFLLYELGRLIEEDRASIEDEEFRRVIDEGIHEHIERRLDVRADLARALRSDGAQREWKIVEDIEAPLRDRPAIVRSYAAYLFRRLEECSSLSHDGGVARLADQLFDSLDDRAAAERAIDALGSRRSAVSARVLAHAISEPMLDEGLESKAYGLVRAMWPLPRHFILYSLKPHAHEDIPFRWFQLLIEMDEPAAVDRILEEILVHGDDPDYREDLSALTELLGQARDPEAEDKIMHVMNSEAAPKFGVERLAAFLKNTRAQRHEDTKSASGANPWAELERIYAANRKYLAIAEMFDEERKPDARRALDELLKEEPQYPFALMLKRLF